MIAQQRIEKVQQEASVLYMQSGSNVKCFKKYHEEMSKISQINKFFT